MLKTKIEEAKKWLADNPDKWEEYIDFKFLVPIDEVPLVVIEYIRQREEDEKYWDDISELERNFL